jgi:VIT1/CCC1 family predicted Fe2+/Mn2+ transporter
MFPGLLVQVLIGLIIVGLVLWVISQIPMDPTIARMIRVVVIVFVAIWMIYILVGLLGGVGGGAPYPAFRR